MEKEEIPERPIPEKVVAHIVLDDDSKSWPCPNCGEILKFLWPPMWHLASRKVSVKCKECLSTMTVGASESLPI